MSELAVETATMDIKILDIALASLEAEAVAWTSEEALAEVCCDETGMIGPQYMVGNIPLYLHAQHAPVVPDEMPVHTGPREFGRPQAYVDGWNACRAAMLQCADDEVGSWHNDKNPPASHTCDEHIRYESNAGGNLWIQCSKQKYERMKAAGMLTRVLTRVFYDTPQNQQQNIPENIPTLRDGVAAIRSSGVEIDAEKIQAERDDLNSPVIQDGWIPVSERMPEQDGNYWGWWSESKRQGPVWFIKSELQAQFQSSEITHWMPLPAAPQQEMQSE